MFLLLRCIHIPPPNLGKNVSGPLSGMHELHIVINVTCFMLQYSVFHIANGGHRKLVTVTVKLNLLLNA